MLNDVSLLGRLTVTPELQHTGSQIPYCRFRLAVDRDYTDPDGNRGTDFISCIAWRHTAEFFVKYFQKGQLAAISGRLVSANWKSRDGENRHKMEVEVNSIYFAGPNLSKKQENINDPYPEENLSAGDFEVLPGEDEQLPF